MDVTNLINNRRLNRALYTFLLANQRNKGFFHDFAGDLLYEDYMVTVISTYIINYSAFRRDWKILTGSFHCSFNLALPNETIAINNNNNNKNKDHNDNSNNNDKQESTSYPRSGNKCPSRWVVTSPQLLSDMFWNFYCHHRVPNENDAQSILYGKPYTRIASYLVGMVLGYVLQSGKSWKISKVI